MRTLQQQQQQQAKQQQQQAKQQSQLHQQQHQQQQHSSSITANSRWSGYHILGSVRLIKAGREQTYLLAPLIVHGCLQGLQGVLRGGHQREDSLRHLLDAGGHQICHVVVTCLEKPLQLLGRLQTIKLAVAMGHNLCKACACVAVHDQTYSMSSMTDVPARWCHMKAD